MTTVYGRTACMKVSIDGCRREVPPHDSASPSDSRPLSKHSRQWPRSTGTRMSSQLAWASHLPDALTHRVPSRLSEVLPLLACTRSGSRPMRADRRSRASSSAQISEGLSMNTTLTSLIGSKQRVWIVSLHAKHILVQVRIGNWSRGSGLLGVSKRDLN